MRKRLKQTKKGKPRARQSAYRNGSRAGYTTGYNAGYSNGFEAGKQSFSQPLAGTSIIIPTYNQGELLKKCIESIQKYTPETHEIIVIDNASTDGTAAYLHSMAGQIRFRINPVNLGFAGGVNQGLKMARGTTLLLLNNDTVVTRSWLANLLTCLHSDEKIGLVGPMTNYISGDQLVSTSYSSMEEMHRFAEQFNRSDPGKWRRVERITGFCLLFRRDLFERLGYFDEGFEKGNCEDDDFCLRVRLLGHELVIAGDSFIHHVGSVSMKALGSELQEVYGRNQDFYGQKWGDFGELLAETERQPHERRSMRHFYPRDLVAVSGTGAVYWLDGGTRRPAAESGPLAERAVRLSFLELRGCAAGEASSADEARSRAEGGTGGDPGEGSLVQAEGGPLYRLEQGQLRRIVSPGAAAAWGFGREKAAAVDGAYIERTPKGLPIIAPISLKADNI